MSVEDKTNLSASLATGLTIPEIDPEGGVMAAAIALVKGGLYVGPMKPGTKSPGSVLGDAWQTKTSNDVPTVVSWFAGTSAAGLFIHCLNLVVLDVDAPDAVPEWLWPHLGGAPMQRTRTGDDPRRGHYFFAMPTGRRIGNALGKLRNAEGVKWGDVRGVNGVVVTAPTKHQNVRSGGLYHWIRTGPVPMLPAELASKLPDSEVAEIGATDAAVETFLTGHDDGDNIKAMTYPLEKFTELAKTGSRHDAAVSAACWIVRDSACDLYAAGPALDTLESMFTRAVGTDRTKWQVASEWRRIVSWAIGQATTEQVEAHRARLIERGYLPNPALSFEDDDEEPSPAPAHNGVVKDVAALGEPEPVEANPSLPPWRRYALDAVGRVPFDFDTTPAGHLPEAFWSARKVHGKVRAVAHSRMNGSTVAMFALLARLAATASPEITLDTGVGTPTRFMTYVAVVDPSGSGKTSGTNVAVCLLPSPADLRIENDKGLTISTGQGMIEAFYGELDASVQPVAVEGLSWSEEEAAKAAAAQQAAGKAKKERGQVRFNRLFYCDEGEALIKQAKKQDSITGAVVKELWTGDPTGQANADEDRRRRIEGYTVGLVAGFQSGEIDTVSGLLADMTGTVQRFLFCTARDHTLPRRPVPVDDKALGGVLTDPCDGWDGSMTLPEQARTELTDHVWHKGQGGTAGDDPRDAHWPLHISRLAALLALLDGSSEVRMADWNLAKIVWESSVRFRQQLRDEKAGYAAAEKQAKLRDVKATAAAHTQGALAATDDYEGKALLSAAGQIGRKVHKDGRMTRSQAQGSCQVRGSVKRKDALLKALDLGYVTPDPEADSHVVPGPVRPPASRTYRG